MKIAVVYHYFAHYRKSVINEIINECERKGNDITFLADRVSNEPNLELYHFEEHENKFDVIKNIWISKFLWQKGLIRALMKSSPDVIVFLGQFNFISTWVATFLFRALGKKIIFWGHGVYGSEKGLKKFIRNRFNNLPHIYMTYGHHAKDLMLKSQAKPIINVIYNSLDVYHQNEFYSKLNSRNHSIQPHNEYIRHKTTLIFIGRLTKIKKIDLLIEALSMLNVNEYRLLIVGAGPEENALKSLVKKLNLDSCVTFVGAIHDEEKISSMIYESDICVSPGNVGLTAMHSLIYGTPVITNDDFNHQMPEFESIRNTVNGGFFKVDNAHSLADTINFWREKIIKEGRGSIRDKCREPILKYYNPENQTRLILEQVYKNVKESEK